MVDKVLMTLMSMQLGGAETHVLELCKALRKQGITVYVASNGGAYESALAACGVTHFKVPLHNKRPDHLIRAYFALRKIIRTYNIPIVHAHARIPGFLCGLLQKRMGFRYVTTAHWVFSTDFPFNLLSNWGERSLAVSADIKQYLIDNYHVPEADIALTVNGIDTDIFTPDIDYEDLKAEFPSLNEKRVRIVSLNRMDKSRSLAAHKLIAAAPALCRAHHNLAIYLVGGGDDYEAVRHEAEVMNQQLAATGLSPCIYLTGGRADSNRWLAAADIFVGVSRALLEAMSTGKPVVAAGNEGFLGLLDDANLPLAMATNFCLRGCTETTADNLTEALLTLLALPPAAREAIGARWRAFIRAHYSAARMAEDARSVYETVLTQERRDPRYKADVMISGYYGYNNSGDDILLRSIIDDLRAADGSLRITVLSRRPKETRSTYGADALFRFNLPAIWLRLRKTKLLITGGGSLMQDDTSTHSLLYYLWVINTAHRLGVKNMLYANGIGPLHKASNMARVRKTVNKADLITLRDEEALSLLRDIGVTRPEIHVTADPAFALRPADTQAARQQLATMGIDGPFFCVAVRDWKQNPSDLETQIATFADYAAETYGYQVLFVSMRPAEDTEIARRTMALMRTPGVLLDAAGRCTHDIRDIVGCAAFVLGMRLHTLIYAVSEGVPVIGLVYDPKVRHLMDAIGQPYYMPIAETDAATLIRFADTIHDDSGAISAAIREAALAARQKALCNATLCMRLLRTVP